MSEGPGQRGITAPERLTLLTSISSVLLQRKRERESPRLGHQACIDSTAAPHTHNITAIITAIEL